MKFNRVEAMVQRAIEARRSPTEDRLAIERTTVSCCCLTLSLQPRTHLDALLTITQSQCRLSDWLARLAVLYASTDGSSKELLMRHGTPPIQLLSLVHRYAAKTGAHDEKREEGSLMMVSTPQCNACTHSSRALRKGLWKVEGKLGVSICRRRL